MADRHIFFKSSITLLYHMVNVCVINDDAGGGDDYCQSLVEWNARHDLQKERLTENATFINGLTVTMARRAHVKSKPIFQRIIPSDVENQSTSDTDRAHRREGWIRLLPKNASSVR